ncbi:MAG: DUF493 domain-containing protein [Planctomycetaceae bacterium]|nr:DUF493 domain-containing protein [Planctomycetaceae bacterium]
MEGLPNRELLEAMHSFPCTYTFKVIGSGDSQFAGRVVSAVRGHLTEDAEPAFSTIKSSRGNHMCVTIEPVVESADMVLKMYVTLRDVEGVVMLM